MGRWDNALRCPECSGPLVENCVKDGIWLRCVQCGRDWTFEDVTDIIQSCGHPLSAIVWQREGTAYCAMCESLAYNPRPLARA